MTRSPIVSRSAGSHLTLFLRFFMVSAALSTVCWISTAAPLSAADADRPLEIKVDSVESMSAYYEEYGLILDRAASDARRSELDQECFMKGSRRFGRIPRPIRFVGLFYDPQEDSGERYTICMAIRPHDDETAKRMCALLGRSMKENRMMEMTVVCGPKQKTG